jgi:hypothetical protein
MAMALEGMHRELRAHLDGNSATVAQIVAWQDLWDCAHVRTGYPMPCPKRFLEGEVARLEPGSSVGDIGRAQCQGCHTVFEFSGG